MDKQIESSAPKERGHERAVIGIFLLAVFIIGRYMIMPVIGHIIP